MRLGKCTHEKHIIGTTIRYSHRIKTVPPNLALLFLCLSLLTNKQYPIIISTPRHYGCVPHEQIITFQRFSQLKNGPPIHVATTMKSSNEMRIAEVEIQNINIKYNNEGRPHWGTSLSIH